MTEYLDERKISIDSGIQVWNRGAMSLRGHAMPQYNSDHPCLPECEILAMRFLPLGAPWGDVRRLGNVINSAVDDWLEVEKTCKQSSDECRCKGNCHWPYCTCAVLNRRGAVDSNGL